jgi:NUMOD3 motif
MTASLQEISRISRESQRVVVMMETEQLHRRMYKIVPKLDKCPDCNRVIKLELCNIRPDLNIDTYNTDINNWYWSCRKCHQISDGRLYRRYEILKDYSARTRGMPRRKHSVKTRAKISEANKGQIPWNKGLTGLTHKGYTPSISTKQKISNRLKGRPSPKKGKPMTEESRNKMSESAKIRVTKSIRDPNTGRFT